MPVERLKSSAFSILSALAFSAVLVWSPIKVWAQEIHLNLKIERYTSTNSEVNIRSYIKNIAEYQGLRLAAIEVEAAALNEVASITVLVNEMKQGETLQLGASPVKFLIGINTDFFMGEGAEEIKLSTPDPAYIKNIVLTLIP